MGRCFVLIAAAIMLRPGAQTVRTWTPSDVGRLTATPPDLHLEVRDLEETTVKTHVRSILTKLGLRDRVQAVVYANEHGLTGPTT